MEADVLQFPDIYHFSNGWTMARETKDKGALVDNQWVLRDENGKWVDCDWFRANLASRFKLCIA